jgi:hypothetical protein
VFENLVDLELVPGADRLPRRAVIIPELALLLLAPLPVLFLRLFEAGAVDREIVPDRLRPCAVLLSLAIAAFTAGLLWCFGWGVLGGGSSP